MPGQLEVAWAPNGLEIAFHPLREHPSTAREPFWVAAVGRAGLLAFVAMPVLVALRAFELVPEAFPPIVLALMAILGAVGEAAIRWRRENAHIVFCIQPSGLELIHTLGRLHVITETVDLDQLRRVDLDEDGTLRLVTHSGRTICEPLPGLAPAAREWIIETVQDVRRSNADFWRDQIASAKDHDAMKRLQDQISPPR